MLIMTIWLGRSKIFGDFVELNDFCRILANFAISGHSERFSPGEIRSEVGHKIALNSPPGRPTLESISPGENLSE